MNAADIIGWVVDGDHFCPDCTPATDSYTADGHIISVSPVYADSETDSFSHCGSCEALIPERLTSDGVSWLVDRATDFLVTRNGRLDIHRMWSEHVGDDYGGDVLYAWRAALQDNNLKLTLQNVKKRVIECLSTL